MDKILCHYCKENEKTQVKGGYYCCDTCQPKPYFIGTPIVETVFVKDYGNVSKKRLDEMGRRKILKETHPDGSYIVGRRGENGKIQDREPSY